MFLRFINALAIPHARSPATRRPMAAVALLLAVGLIGCDSQASFHSLSGNTMGTYYRVTSDCALRSSELEAELQRVNGQMSNYDPESQLSKVNRAALGEWQSVDVELLEVLTFAQQVHQLSDGALDITIAPVLALWGFGPAAEPLTGPPDPQALRRAAERVSAASVVLRLTPPAVRRDRDVALDLSAIAKGHGVDRLAKLLRTQSCQHFLIDIGGEVRGYGRSSKQQPWRVGIEVPDSERMGAVARVVRLVDQAVATSGDYRNYIELDGPDATGPGPRWSHTIDPRTAEPVDHTLASVSVIAADAMTADALATALNVLGPDAGYALAERQSIAALFIERTAQGFEERYTPAFAAALEP